MTNSVHFINEWQAGTAAFSSVNLQSMSRFKGNSATADQVNDAILLRVKPFIHGR